MRGGCEMYIQGSDMVSVNGDFTAVIVIIIIIFFL